MSDGFSLDIDALQSIARTLDDVSNDLSAVDGRLDALLSEIGAAGPLARSALSTVQGVRGQIRSSTRGLGDTAADVRERWRELDASQRAGGAQSDAQGSPVIELLREALDTVGSALPTLDLPQLDPQGQIASAERGQPVNPLEWSHELSDLEAQSILADAPDAVRNAQTTVDVPGLGQQTVSAEGLIALALDPANLIGANPIESEGAGLVEHEATAALRSEPVRQITSDLTQLFAHAAEAKPYVDDLTRQVADKSNGEAILAPLKSVERAAQKIQVDYNGDASQLLDVVRSSVVVDSTSDLQVARQTLETQGDVVRVKDRFTNPAPGGYRDMLYNVRAPNGHIGEVQLHLRQILEAKSGAGHAIYEQIRGIQADIASRGTPPTAEEMTRLGELYSQSEQLYQQAVDAATAP